MLVRERVKVGDRKDKSITKSYSKRSIGMNEEGRAKRGLEYSQC